MTIGSSYPRRQLLRTAAFVVATLIFLTLVLVTSSDATRVSGAVAAICTATLAVITMRKSSKPG
jgi:hypothetical protein